MKGNSGWKTVTEKNSFQFLFQIWESTCPFWEDVWQSSVASTPGRQSLTQRSADKAGMFEPIDVCASAMEGFRLWISAIQTASFSLLASGFFVGGLARARKKDGFGGRLALRFTLSGLELRKQRIHRQHLPHQHFCTTPGVVSVCSRGRFLIFGFPLALRGVVFSFLFLTHLRRWDLLHALHLHRRSLLVAIRTQASNHDCLVLITAPSTYQFDHRCYAIIRHRILSHEFTC